MSSGDQASVSWVLIDWKVDSSGHFLWGHLHELGCARASGEARLNEAGNGGGKANAEKRGCEPGDKRLEPNMKCPSFELDISSGRGFLLTF